MGKAAFFKSAVSSPDRSHSRGDANGSLGVSITTAGTEFLMLIAGLIEVNLMRSADGILIFPVHRVISTLAFTFLACLFISCVGVFVSLHTSTVRQATQVLNIGFMVLGFAALYASISLPQEWRTRLAQAFTTDNLMRTEFSAGILIFIIDLVCLAAARLTFRRHKWNLV